MDTLRSFSKISGGGPRLTCGGIIATSDGEESSRQLEETAGYMLGIVAHGQAQQRRSRVVGGPQQLDGGGFGSGWNCTAIEGGHDKMARSKNAYSCQSVLTITYRHHFRPTITLVIIVLTRHEFGRRLPL